MEKTNLNVGYVFSIKKFLSFENDIKKAKLNVERSYVPKLDYYHYQSIIMSNIIQRGFPTLPSIYLEHAFLKKSYINSKLKVTYDGSLEFAIEEFDNLVDMMRDYIYELNSKAVGRVNPFASLLAAAYIEYEISIAILSGILNLEKTAWTILVEEHDCSPSKETFIDFYIWMKKLSFLTGKYDLPKMNIFILNNHIRKERNFNNKELTITFINNNDDLPRDVDFTIEISLNKPLPDNKYKKYKSQYVLISRSPDDKSFSPKKNFPKAVPTKYQNSPEIRKALRYVLQNIFRKYEFRQKQEEAIISLLHLEPTLALLPTGSGKSLIYQLATLLQPGTTIIIDPIKSLMKDQYNELKLLKIDAVGYINSDIDYVERKRIIKEFSEGQYKYIFISPERLQIKDFQNILIKIIISYIVVDEAHCVSEWGHDFRPAYLNISKRIKKLTKNKQYTPPIVGLTATASYVVFDDIMRELEISDGVPIYPETFDRPELKYEIVKTESYKEKKNALLNILDKLKSELNLNSIVEDSGITGVIFSSHVNGELGVYEIRRFLLSKLENSIGKVEMYSGSTPKEWQEGNFNEYKEKVFERFKNGNIPILVATKSFGMGVNSKNIRYTIHYMMPSSLEEFYQQSGRAGRDGNKAYCYLIYTEGFRGDLNCNIQLNKIFDRNLPLKKFYSLYKDLENCYDADVLKQIFFHENSFKGEWEEANFIKSFFKKYLSPIYKKYKEGKKVYIKLKYTIAKNPLYEGTTLNYLSVNNDREYVNHENNIINEVQLLGLEEKAYTFHGKYEFAYDTDNKDKIDFEKAIYRLVSIGIVDDYIVDYKNLYTRIYTIYLTVKNKEEILDDFYKYIIRYRTKGYARMLKSKLNMYLNNNFMEFVEQIIDELVKFVYSEIEMQRRNAILNISETIREAQSGEDLKEAMINYLNLSDFSKIFSSLREEQDLGKTREFIEQNMKKASIEELKRMYGALQRLSESFVKDPILALLMIHVKSLLDFADEELIMEWNSLFDAIFDNFEDGKQILNNLVLNIIAPFLYENSRKYVLKKIIFKSTDILSVETLKKLYKYSPEMVRLVLLKKLAKQSENTLIKLLSI